MYLFFFRESFRKTNKKIEDQGRKQLDAIRNKKERQTALTNKGDEK